jgi:hypothetical protein
MTGPNIETSLLDDPEWTEEANGPFLIEAARKMVVPAEFRVREEMDLLSRQWMSILGSLFVLVYLVLMVFLNLAYYRYEPPESGKRLKDLGYEIIPELPDDYLHVVDVPLTVIYIFVGIVLFSTLRVCFPCRRGARLHRNDDDVPYVVNMVRRFALAYAAGHVLRAMTYLVTSVPGGNPKCLLTKEEMANSRPTLAECFYRTASVTSNCGDLMFSGHLLLCTLVLCITNRYVAKAMGLSEFGRRLYIGIGIFLTVWELVMIIAARHHYTSDCIVALYFTPALWFCFEYYNPNDLVPDRIHIARIIIARNETLIVGRNSYPVDTAHRLLLA